LDRQIVTADPLLAFFAQDADLCRIAALDDFCLQEKGLDTRFARA